MNCRTSPAPASSADITGFTGAVNPTSPSVPAPLDVNSCTLGEDTEGLLIRMRYPYTNTPAGTVLAGNTSIFLHSCHPDSVEMFIDIDTDIDGTMLTTNTMEVVGISGQFDKTLLPKLKPGLFWRVEYDDLARKHDLDGDGKWDVTLIVAGEEQE